MTGFCYVGHVLCLKAAKRVACLVMLVCTERINVNRCDAEKFSFIVIHLQKYTGLCVCKHLESMIISDIYIGLFFSPKIIHSCASTLNSSGQLLKNLKQQSKKPDRVWGGLVEVQRPKLGGCLCSQ